MKKKMARSIVQLLATFLITSGCFIGYVSANTHEYLLSDEDRFVSIAKVVETVVEEEVEEDAVLEETEEDPVSEESSTISPVQPTVVHQPATSVVSGNSIRVGGITRNLMKDENGDHFYLNHNIDGVYDGVGVPYIDFRHDFTGRKTIIYSHSSTGGNGPFQMLQNYHNNPSYFYNNRYITVSYNGSTYTYEIFSVYVSLADSEESEGLEYFHRMSYTDSEWGERIQQYKNKSEYDTGVSVSSSDKILILQTCSMDPNYYARYYRYNLLIMGKLV